MGYLVAIVIVSLGLIKKSSKIVTALMAFYCWALVALNTYTADFASYEEMYRCSFETRYSLHEPGYMLLCKIMLYMGLDYRQFRMVIALLMVILIVSGMRSCTKNVNFALSLLIIFPFASWISGLRFAMSAAITIYGSRFLFMTGKNATLKYIGIIILATTFHYSALFYLIFLLTKQKKIGFDFMSYLVLIAFISTIFFARVGMLYKLGSMLTKSEKVLQWLEFRGNISPLYILMIMLYICVIFILTRALIIAKVRESKGYVTGKYCLSSANIDKVRKIALLSILSFAGALFNGVVFLRLSMTAIPLYYTVIGEMLVLTPFDSFATKREQILWKIIMPIFCLCVTLFVFGYWIGGKTLQVYQNNLLFF